MGYEPDAIEFLVNLGYPVKDIEAGSSKIGSFSYRFKGKDRKYYPDILYKKTYYEVKSTYTAGIGDGAHGNTYSLRAKMKAVEAAGHRIIVLIKVREVWLVVRSSDFKKVEVTRAVNQIKLKKVTGLFHLL